MRKKLQSKRNFISNILNNTQEKKKIYVTSSFLKIFLRQLISKKCLNLLRLSLVPVKKKIIITKVSYCNESKSLEN